MFFIYGHFVIESVPHPLYFKWFFLFGIDYNVYLDIHLKMQFSKLRFGLGLFDLQTFIAESWKVKGQTFANHC